MLYIFITGPSSPASQSQILFLQSCPILGSFCPIPDICPVFSTTWWDCLFSEKKVCHLKSQALPSAAGAVLATGKGAVFYALPTPVAVRLAIPTAFGAVSSRPLPGRRSSGERSVLVWLLAQLKIGCRLQQEDFKKASGIESSKSANFAIATQLLANQSHTLGLPEASPSSTFEHTLKQY